MLKNRQVAFDFEVREKDVRRDPNEAEIIQIIKRERARREEALGFAKQANRADLIEQNEAEAKILSGYLPAEVPLLSSGGRVSMSAPAILLSVMAMFCSCGCWLLLQAAAAARPPRINILDTARMTDLPR